MRPETLLYAFLLTVLIAGPIFAQTDAAQMPDEQKRESLKQVTALFIITLLVLVVMFGAMVALSILMRRRRRELEQQKPEMPTELEDLWWKMNLPEDREKKE